MFEMVKVQPIWHCWICFQYRFKHLHENFHVHIVKFIMQFIGATMGASDLHIQTENGQIGMPSNICCVIVEYCPGGALKSYLIKNRRRKLAFKVVVQLALDLARGSIPMLNLCFICFIY